MDIWDIGQFRYIMNSASVNIFCVFHGTHMNAFLFGIHLRLFAGSWGMHIFSFSRSLQRVFLSGCTFYTLNISL